MTDLNEMLPEDKFDTDRANALVTLGYPAVAPILGDLMKWLQDLNWPVGQVLAPFLCTIGAPLIPYVRQIMNSDDTMWKYWVIGSILTYSKEAAVAFRDDLLRIALTPDSEEITHELHDQAKRALVRHGWLMGDA